MVVNKAVISDRAAKRVEEGHFWVYRSDIIDIKFNGTQPMYLYDRKRHFLGTALYSPRSQIALRICRRSEVDDITDYIRSAIFESVKYRDSLHLDGDCYRIVHSEADGLPGLVVDRYADTVVFQTLTEPMEGFKDIIVKNLSDLTQIRQIFEKNTTRSREIEGLPSIMRTVYGEDRGHTFCCENHRFFYVDFYDSQKTSEFLDQKINRRLVGEMAKGSVLDLFCYHSWFGCNLSGAEDIIAVDSSSQALNISRINFSLNGLYRFTLLEKNVFDLLREYDISRKRFDTIILDPPGFIKSRSHFSYGYNGYKEINLRAMKILNSGGILITFSCSYYMSDSEFLKMLREAASDARSDLETIKYLHQSPDHREVLGFPESHYLKGYILRKL